MKALIYWTCISLIGLVTIGSAYSCVDMAMVSQQLVQENPEAEALAAAGETIGILTNLLVWAVVVTPIGIIALLSKPDRSEESAEETQRRRRPV